MMHGLRLLDVASSAKNLQRTRRTVSLSEAAMAAVPFA
jgi:hypothetical protein